MAGPTPPEASGNGPPTTAGESTGAGESPIDVQLLAEKVYQLMRADLRLETIRTGSRARE